MLQRLHRMKGEVDEMKNIGGLLIVLTPVYLGTQSLKDLFDP